MNEKLPQKTQEHTTPADPPSVDKLLTTSKNPGGAPKKFESVEEVQTAIDLFFSKCDDRQEPYTITGLALALKTNRQTLINYQKDEMFFDTITNAKQKCENYVEKYLFTGKNTAGAIFNMINNYRGWKNTNDINVGGQPDNELKISVSFTGEK